jgi:hypothetical protein
MEHNWVSPLVNPLTVRDGTESSLFDFFNFAKAPLQPLILPETSLAIYPWQSCVQRGICHQGSPSGPMMPKELDYSHTYFINQAGDTESVNPSLDNED